MTFQLPCPALSDDIEGSDYYSRIAEFSRGTSREHIKISVVYIAPQTDGVDESERVAREIARMGSGRFQLVRAIEHLPLEALESVV